MYRFLPVLPLLLLHLLVSCSAKTPIAVRFLAFGDSGTGGAGQQAVADVARDVCARRGCDFVLLLGDNIYDSGVTTTDDPQWQEKFETPYAMLDGPFRPALGNHDYGVGTNDWPRGVAQVDYSAVSQKWDMPDTHYAFTRENVGLLVLDTTAMFWEDDITNGDQSAWLPGAIAGLGEVEWTIATGHHPYRSNGRHGDAGDYDGTAGIAIIDGGHIKDFFDTNLCGKIDVYLAGHDHSLQWLEEPWCGAELLVSGGGGAGPTPVVDDRHPSHFQLSGRGLLHVEIEGPSFTGRFYDESGAMLFERTVLK